MARIRTLKPEFWQDEKLAPLPPIDRLVFLGLISQADDAGRLVDNPRLIDGLLFPETGDSSRESLETLARLGRILRYRSESGQRLIQIVGWDKHQKVQKPSAYVLPAPAPEAFAALDVTRDSGETPESVQSVSGDSPSPIPDLRPTTYDQRPTTTAAAAADTDLFNEFWKAYPRRAGSNPKNRALKAWRARIRSGAKPSDIMAGLRRYAAFVDATGKAGTEFVMQAATFLGPDERWTESWALDRAKAPPPPAGSEAARRHNEMPGSDAGRRSRDMHHIGGEKHESDIERDTRRADAWAERHPDEAKAILDELRDEMASDNRWRGLPERTVELAALGEYRRRILERARVAA